MSTNAATPLVLTGRPASPGFASGPVCVLATHVLGQRLQGDARQEAAALRAAISNAVAALKQAIGRTGDDAAEILGFQVAMLEDDALSEGAFDAISLGIAAQHAWNTCIDNEIADYKASHDEYFGARAADLNDLKERVLGYLTGTKLASLQAGSIVVADDLSPSRFLAHDWKGGGIVLSAGSGTSHVAMLARSRGVPMLTGTGMAEISLLHGCDGLLDAGQGRFLVNPSPASRAEHDARHQDFKADSAIAASYEKQPARSANGTGISVHINIADVAELDHLDPAMCDGVGLVRTELLFESSGLPGEEAQYQAYRKIAEWAKGRPVTIRTLDAGADKPIEGLTPVGESNPFLGVRGVRLTLQRPEIFSVQLRALARASAHGKVQIMVPMVSVPDEMAATRVLLDSELARLRQENIAHGNPLLGMMVEVPAAAIAIDTFTADFFSIGSNDLTQYVMAAGRDIAAVADLADAGNPAVLRLITQIAAYGRQHRLPVSLCGDAAGDADMLPKLLAAGLRSLSVAPGLVGTTKARIAALQVADA